MTTRALVYGDIDLNLIDGSAIWLQSVTQALARAGCAVTLVLKAPVRTSRLIAPLLAEPGITVRRPFEEHLVEGLEGVRVPVRAAAAAGLLARLDAEQPTRPGGAARPRGDLGGDQGRGVRRAAMAVPDRCPAVRPRPNAGSRRRAGNDRLGRPLPAVPDRGAPLLSRGQHPRLLRQIRPAAADAGRHTRGPWRSHGRHSAAAGLHGQVRAAVEHPGDDRASRAAFRPRHRLRAAHGRRQDPR